MREILFKAKRIDNGEWVIGDLSQHKTGKKFIKCGDARSSFEVDENTICQYTGLTDNNGNKIWENDIVKTYNSRGQECHIEHIVWADYSLNYGWCSKGIKSLIKYDKRVFDTGFSKSDARKCEVIGNAFDNKELLEET